MKYNANLQTNYGIWIALVIVTLWFANLAVAFQINLTFTSPLTYLLFWIQTHLFTGLFITAHDAIHGTVAPNHPKLNNWIGRICTTLYAFFPYQKLYTEHHKHHKFVHTEADPDYYEGNIFTWYLQFVKHYVSFWQIVCYAITYNVLKLVFPYENLIFFWIIPAIVSTLQLFYFGTYLPHKGEHTNKHQSTSQTKNHLWAFLTCYFFGYHYEHHDAPYAPWWQLWKIREQRTWDI